MHSNVVLDDLRDQAVYRSARRDHNVQHLAATLFFFECPLHRFDLTADASNPVQEFCLLADRVRHVLGVRRFKMKKITMRGRHCAELAPLGLCGPDRTLRKSRR